MELSIDQIKPAFLPFLHLLSHSFYFAPSSLIFICPFLLFPSLFCRKTSPLVSDPPSTKWFLDSLQQSSLSSCWLSSNCLLTFILDGVHFSFGLFSLFRHLSSSSTHPLLHRLKSPLLSFSRFFPLCCAHTLFFSSAFQTNSLRVVRLFSGFQSFSGSFPSHVLFITRDFNFIPFREKHSSKLNYSSIGLDVLKADPLNAKS